jgi:tetratricopeptide (TPR) repeat protein
MTSLPGRTKEWEFNLMPRTPSILAAICVVLCHADGQDVRRPPTEQDRETVTRMGWTQAADSLATALSKAYQPGRTGNYSTAVNASFQSWLLLWQWSELLSRNEINEAGRFLGRYVYPAKGDSDAKFAFLPPGISPPDDLQPLPESLLRELAADRDARKRLFEALLPADYEPVDAPIAARLDPKFLAAMTRDEPFLRTFFANLSENDFAPVALLRLQEIWTEHAKKWAGYLNLAVAIAIVRDQRPPAFWPHPQVRPSDVPIEAISAAAQFAFWVDANENAQLLLDLPKLGADHLKFVIDAPVALTEFTWAQKNIRFPRGDFGRAFSSIEYANDRITSRQFSWKNGAYTLSTIDEDGGICVDQAYFAMLAGKAKGLPTLFFTGQGADGGHAWFGYMKGDDRWDMDCGRYENQNYAVGEALDPQSWLPITDHELKSLAQSFRRTPQYAASAADLVLSRLLERTGSPERALLALDSAIGVSPANDLAWNAKSRFLARTNAPAAAQLAHHEAALKQFASNTDLKVRHQQALARISRAMGANADAEAYESQIISENRRRRTDLSVNAAAQKLTGLVDAKQLDAAMREYRSLVSRLAKTSGGNFFYEIVAPFSRALLDSGDASAAERAVDMARAALRPDDGSILDIDLSSLEAEIKNAPKR